MKFQTANLTDDERTTIIEQMESVGQMLVTPDTLEHNHGEKLRHWLSDEFMLFRGKTCVDDYIAFDLTRRGDGQFLPFSMVRESSSDNYADRQGTYYLTLDKAEAVVIVMSIIQGSLQGKRGA